MVSTICLPRTRTYGQHSHRGWHVDAVLALLFPRSAMLSTSAHTTHQSSVCSLRSNSRVRNTVCHASSDDRSSQSSGSSDTAWDAAHMPILRHRIADLEMKMRNAGAARLAGPRSEASKSDSHGCASALKRASSSSACDGPAPASLHF